MKQILVIGGSYFAGRVFVEELAKLPDYAIHVFNRGRQPLGIAGVTEHTGDREQPDQFRAAIPPHEWEAVVDFCAYAPSDIENALAHLRGKVKQYIYISTTTVLQTKPILPVPEDGLTLTGPQIELGRHAGYGHNKLLAERALQLACSNSSTSYTILRPAIIYGFYNYAPRETYFFDLLRNRQPIIIPTENLALFSFIWVVDMARLIIRCIGDERTYSETFNLASNELISYERIVQVLAEITGKDISPIHMPAEEIDQRKIPLPFPLNDHLIFSGAKIQRLFDFDYTPFKQGMREALKYYMMIHRHKSPPAP